MESHIECATSDPFELARIIWLSIGLMLDPYLVMKVAGFIVSVVLCAFLLLKCALREEPSHHKHHRY